jgi:hypothetical protein
MRRGVATRPAAVVGTGDAAFEKLRFVSLVGYGS